MGRGCLWESLIFVNSLQLLVLYQLISTLQLNEIEVTTTEQVMGPLELCELSGRYLRNRRSVATIECKFSRNSMIKPNQFQT